MKNAPRSGVAIQPRKYWGSAQGIDEVELLLLNFYRVWRNTRHLKPVIAGNTRAFSQIQMDKLKQNFKT